MKQHLRRLLLASGLVAAVALTACSPDATEPAPSPSPTESPEFTGFKPWTYPKVDGSTATHPLNLAFKEEFTGASLTPENLPISKTHQAYLKLIAGEVDLILVTTPSEDELAAAQAAGVELEVIPVVHEAFVFMTNSGNPVTNLTVDQLRDIYAGRITNWRQVGGPNSSIVAFQRPENSGSQTGILELVMKGTPMMPAPRAEYVISDMEGTVDAVANYDNSSGALGYSYYYFVTAMYGELAKGNTEDGVRLVSVNGVAPREETIRSGAYPLTSAYYIVINKAAPADSPARRLAEMMLSEAGQRIAQRTGYVPVLPLPPLEPPTYTAPPPGPFSITSLDESYVVNQITVTKRMEQAVERLTVDGLADQRVEDAVNARIRQLQDDFLAVPKAPGAGLNQLRSTVRSSPTPDQDVEGVAARYYVFGNVLSLQFSHQGHWSDATVRLDTGDEMAFRDLFVDGASIEGILASAYYEHLVVGGASDMADVEAQILDMLGDYRRDPSPSFSILMGGEALVEVGHRRFSFRLTDYWQSVAVFKRFVRPDNAALYTAPPAGACPVFRVKSPSGSCMGPEG